MKLEEELKQGEFKSEYQKAILNILVTANWLENDLAKKLKPFGISSQQYNVLRILKGQGSEAISVNDIMSRMIDKMSNTSRLVEKLRKKELIERVTCSEDRRRVDVRITTKGIALLVKADVVINDLDDISAVVTEKEASTLNLLLENIRT